MMHALSAIGDTALLAPASLALLFYLAALRRWAEARAFVACLAFGLGATLLSKLVFKACGAGIESVDINSPSGHASFATLFYGSLALLMTRGRPAWVAWPIRAVAALLVVAIGASRIRIGVHSAEEVVLGWLIGAGGLAVFSLLQRGSERRALSPWPLAAGLALAILLVDGRQFTAEHYIGRVARYASASLDICTRPRVTGLTLRLGTRAQ
jgi:membrane-associated phospholipid phosphatase